VVLASALCELPDTPTVVFPQQLPLHAKDGVDDLLLLARHGAAAPASFWHAVKVVSRRLFCAEDTSAVGAAVGNASVELAGGQDGSKAARAITLLCAVVEREARRDGGGKRDAWELRCRRRHDIGLQNNLHCTLRAATHRQHADCRTPPRTPPDSLWRPDPAPLSRGAHEAPPQHLRDAVPPHPAPHGRIARRIARRNMEDYPPAYVQHNLPFIVLSGLGTTSELGPPPPVLNVLPGRAATTLSSDSPPVTSNYAAPLLQDFLSADGTGAPWNGRASGRKGLTHGFRIRAVGRVGRRQTGHARTPAPVLMLARPTSCPPRRLMRPQPPRPRPRAAPPSRPRRRGPCTRPSPRSRPARPSFPTA
jgi:hypothetical protein